MTESLEGLKAMHSRKLVLFRIFSLVTVTIVGVLLTLSISREDSFSFMERFTYLGLAALGFISAFIERRQILVIEERIGELSGS